MALRFVSKAKATLPYAARRVEPQLFHIPAPRPLQRVNARPPKLWPELLKKARQGQNFRPHILAEGVEFRLKLIADLNRPAHRYNMTCSPYVLKRMCDERLIPGMNPSGAAYFALEKNF
jgi:hypothetical protein